MNKTWFFVLGIGILLLASLASAQEPYHLKLLAVQEANNTYEGVEADLYLELKEGSGRVFLDTFPLTKIDTQISTRFATEIACNHYKLDCDEYDFIYTIKAKSNIIGGPSAGAAIAALTTIAMLGLDHDEQVAVTGTINSGGIIGQVGGIKEKLKAGSKVNLKKVLIPKSSAKKTTNFHNITKNMSSVEPQLDLVKFAKENLSLEAVEVIDLDEVIFYLTGVELNHHNISIDEDPQYRQIMGELQKILCKRTELIQQELTQEKISINENLTKEINKRKGDADNATHKLDYYSAASYCFGTNILLKKYYYQKEKVSLSALRSLFRVLNSKTDSLEKKLSTQKIETISDLQTLMIVKERLSDVKDQIKIFEEEGKEQNKPEMYALLAYAEERFFSALSWMHFFDMDGKKIVLDKGLLADSCLQKISEAEEMHQYVSIFIGESNVYSIKEKIDGAKRASEQQEYELCLMKASQAKGDANAIFSSIGWDEESFFDFLDSKTKAVERVIAENSAEGQFPILGYSYLQYARSLKEEEMYHSLMYLEYALEMSNLDLYFPEQVTWWDEIQNLFDFSQKWWSIIEGFIIGVIATLILLIKKPQWLKKLS